MKVELELTEQEINLLFQSLPNASIFIGIKNELREHINPIIDNRIVNDITFATRFKSFLDKTAGLDTTSSEDWDYLMSVANWLLTWQKSTIEDDNEKAYFNNLVKNK